MLFSILIGIQFYINLGFWVLISPIVLASFAQVQILMTNYSKIVFAFKTQIVYSSDFRMKKLNKTIHAF